MRIDRSPGPGPTTRGRRRVTWPSRASRLLALLLTVTLLAGGAAWPGAVAADTTTHQVACGGDLAQAIKDAASGDTISLDGSCTYELSTALSWLFKTLTIDGNGATITRSSSASEFAIFQLGGSGNLTLNHVTVSNGVGSYGGGIYVGGGSLTLNDSTVTGNQATSSGGGIYVNSAGIVALHGSTVSDNQASSTGAGIYGAKGAQVFIEGGSVVRDNSAGFGGAGLYMDNGTATITDSTLSGNTAATYGGGIYNAANSTVTVLRSTLTDNKATGNGGGGGIYSVGPLTLRESTLSSNTTGGSGAGISGSGTLTVSDTTLASNQVNGTGVGGGLYVWGGTVTLSDSTLSKNTAQNGGGIYSSNTQVTIERGSFTGNSAGDGGGAINNYGGTLTLSDSTLNGNQATRGSGGGIVTYSATVVITGSTLSNNQASTRSGNGGGGIYSNSGDVSLTNTTVASNKAYQGGGVYQGSETLTLTNSTVSGNSANSKSLAAGIYAYQNGVTLRNTIVAKQATGVNCAVRTSRVSITDGGSNLASDNTCNLSSANGSLANSDPKLGPLADNGGATLTMLPAADSPAIGAGNTTNCPATDQRGISRPQGTRCDIGAVEIELQSQSITFGSLTDQPYGTAPFTVSATATSGLPVTFASTTTDVCTTSGTNGATITLVGTGTCTITADQAGNETWDAAPQASTSFTVTPAALTITADDQTITVGDALPTFTWTASGWVNGEDEQVLSQAPTCTTSADATSPAGSYPITCTGAVATNYTIDYADGTLTIMAPPKQAQTISIDPVSDQTYGAAPPTLNASATSNLPVSFASATETVCTVATDGQVTIVGVGTCTLTADQAGNSTWEAAVQVSRSFAVTPAALTITADDQTITVGDALPAFTWTASGWVNGEDEQVLSQAPTCTTSADVTSPAGSYSIVCEGALAANYTISYTDGTLTILAPEVLTPSLTPTTSQLTVGDSATLTVTVTSSRGTAVPDGTPVSITVSGANSQSTTVTTSNGQASFSYSAVFPGSDTITATIGEQSAQASVIWQAPASARFASVFLLTPMRPTALVSANSLYGRPRGLIFYRGSDFSLYSQTITGVVTQRGAATVFGTATVDGQAVVFRVDLTGGLFSGTLRIQLSNGYDTGVLRTRSGLIM